MWVFGCHLIYVMLGVKWKESQNVLFSYSSELDNLPASITLWSRNNHRVGLKLRPGMVTDLNSSTISTVNFLVFKKWKETFADLFNPMHKTEKNIYIRALVVQVVSHMSSNLFTSVQWNHQLQRDHSHDSRFGGSVLIYEISWRVRKRRTVFSNIPFLCNLFTFL